MATNAQRIIDYVKSMKYPPVTSDIQLHMLNKHGLKRSGFYIELNKLLAEEKLIRFSAKDNSCINHYRLPGDNSVFETLTDESATENVKINVSDEIITESETIEITSPLEFYDSVSDSVRQLIEALVKKENLLLIQRKAQKIEVLTRIGSISDDLRVIMADICKDLDRMIEEES